MKSVSALSFPFCLNSPAIFSQPHTTPYPHHSVDVINGSPPNVEWNVFACRIAEREAAKQIEILPSPQNAEKNEREWVRSFVSL